MKVFKFSKRKFVSSASFRLGTLYDFRREEKYGAQVGDRIEGASRGVQETFPFWSDFDPGKILTGQPFESMWAKGNETEGLKRHVLSVTSQDLLVFCVTQHFDESLYDVFDSDVCLEIEDWNGFTKALIRALPLPVEKYCSDACCYLEKDFFAASGSLPRLPFWKEPRYASQKEVRLCVSVAVDPITPVTVSSPAALSFCTMRERNDA